MEASHRPQLPFDEGPGAEASVRAIDDRLVIERLEVEDVRAAKLVRERAEAGHPPAQTVRDAIEIGARVLEREGTAAEVDYVRAEFERQAGELRERLGRALEAGDEMLAERITLSFDASRDGSVQKQIDELVHVALGEQRDALLKLFSAQEGSNPLFDFKDAMVKVYRELGNRQQAEGAENRKVISELRREVQELRGESEADRRVAEAEHAGTRKGFSFEERVHDELGRIAALRGDCASHTGAEHAEGGGKKGDTLIEIAAAAGPPCGRIVFEAKDKKLSRNDAWAELNTAMDARAAGFAVLVVAGSERVPARTQQLHEYEGNKMIVALDRDDPDTFVLEVAYRLAAARVAMARDSELQVDPVAVRDSAQDALSTLKQSQAIRSNLTGIKTSSDKARAALDAMVESVRARLERIEALIEEAEPE